MGMFAGKSRRLAASSGLAMVVFASGAAHGQVQAAPSSTEAERPTSADAPAPSSPGEPGEIVVTAQKREQSINKVGLTIAAVGAEQLSRQHIVDLSDIASVVPGLSYTTSASNTPVFTLRGVGFYDVTLGASPTVSVYEDQAPLPFPVLTSQINFDIERVEILKGPQGTLFGQNSTGGAINFIGAKPTSSLEAGGDISFSRFATFEGNAYISGPLSDTLSARVAGHVIVGGGWQKGYYLNDRKNGAPEAYAGRATIDWHPSATAKFELTVNAWKDGSEPIAPKYFGIQAQVGGIPPGLVNYPFAPNNPRSADFSPDHPPFANNRFLSGVLRGDIGLTSNLTLTSLTSYIDFKLHQTQGGDAVAIDDLDVFNQRGKINSFSQELRVSNGAAEPIRFTVGGNYEHDKVDETSDITFQEASSHYALGINSGEYTTNQKMRTYAAFGDAEYDVFKFLTIKGGIRYTNSRRSAYMCYLDPGFDGGQYTTGNFFYALSRGFGNELGPYEPGHCFVLDNITQDGTPATYLPGSFNYTLREHNISWRTGLDIKPATGTLIYANVSKGYKAGSFPAVSAAVQSEYLPVTQESVLAYEGGIKQSLFDRHVQLNLAGFYYDYRNKQLRTKTIDPVFGIVDALVNIPKSRSKGVELEANYSSHHGLTANLDFIYLDSKIIRYAGINAGGVAANFAGALVPFSPKYQATGSVDEEFALGERLSAFVGATVKYRSRSSAVVGFYDPTYAINSYALVDLRAGIRPGNGPWRVEIWGKNITNKYYWNNVVASYDTLGRYPAMGATYGVTIGVNFR
jgi:iron complex outermembrane receptor protein